MIKANDIKENRKKKLLGAHIVYFYHKTTLYCFVAPVAYITCTDVGCIRYEVFPVDFAKFTCTSETVTDKKSRYNPARIFFKVEIKVKYLLCPISPAD